MKPINVLSTFNGMGCIWYALDHAGIPVNKRYSSEIDKYANQANDAAYNDTIQLSDVTKWREWNIDWSTIGLFVGGSPCQGFSFAGKQLNFEDERSKLFFEFVAIWNHIKKHNPDAKFLLENVNMKKEYLRVISEYMGVFPVRINSNLVSAQNRDRWYWTNIKTKETGLFSELWTDIPQPENKGILLKDILQPESEVDQKYYIKNTKVDFEGLSIDNKAPTQRSSTGRCLDKKHNYQIIKVDKEGNKKADQEKAGCLTAGGNSGGNHSDMDIICLNYSTAKHQQDRIYSPLGKSPSMTASNNDDKRIIVSQSIIQLAHGFNKGGEFKDKSPTLLSNSWEHNNHVSDGYTLRRLTPRECGKLQTFTDAELDVLLSSGISDTQLYKMFGNGWTISVISWILSFMK